MRIDKRHISILCEHYEKLGLSIGEIMTLDGEEIVQRGDSAYTVGIRKKCFILRFIHGKKRLSFSYPWKVSVTGKHHVAEQAVTDTLIRTMGRELREILDLRQKQ